MLLSAELKEHSQRLPLLRLWRKLQALVAKLGEAP